MRRLVDLFRKPKHRGEVKNRPLEEIYGKAELKEPRPERTFGDGATQREKLIRLKRKAARKHKRRQKRR